jgi:ATP-binding cassette subfamily C protein
LPPLALFAAATFRMVPAVNRIMYGLNALRHYGPSVDVALQEIRGFEAPGCARRPDEGPGHPVAFEKEIRLTAVSYQYPSRERPAVRDVTVTIRRGTCVGVVGESGSGKSTLADLLLGLLVPTGGQVLVDGVDIATDTQAWQRNLGYVPRDVYVADETIRRNVALGLSDLEIDDERVWEALRLANLDEFVTSLPGGIETSLGERGVRLSDGQRQRVGIARALYHNPVVVVFDEATAALDVTTEHEVTRAIRNLKGHKTLVVIAHRLSTVTVCDQLLLMRSGNLIDVGTFGELAERNPDFSRAVDLADLSPWATRRS